LVTDESSIYQGKFLLKRGNYSILKLLVTIHAAGSEGIATCKLLDEIGSHATYTQGL
jgi:hypothetical protein